jgi:predicted glycosyltransferase
MSPEQQQQIYQQAQQLPGVTVLEFTNDLMSYVNTANTVISMLRSLLRFEEGDRAK